MCKAWEDQKIEGREEGKMEGKIECINNLVSKRGFDIEDACDIVGVTVEEYEVYNDTVYVK